MQPVKHPLEARAAPHSRPLSFDPAGPVHPEILSRTLRAVADVLDGHQAAGNAAPQAATSNGCSCPPADLAALARGYLRHRRERERMLPDLFADPAWDILVDLFASAMERRPVSVSSACVAAAVPPTTGLRWIGTLESRGLIFRVADPDDHRRTYLQLSEAAEDAIASWLAGLGRICEPGTRENVRTSARAGVLRIPAIR
jgi:hypothetical protein